MCCTRKSALGCSVLQQHQIYMQYQMTSIFKQKGLHVTVLLYILSSFSKSLQFCIAVKTRFACAAPESLHLGVQCCSSTKSMQYQMTFIFKQKGLHVTVPLYIFIPHYKPTGEQCQWEGHVQGNMA